MLLRQLGNESASPGFRLNSGTSWLTMCNISAARAKPLKTSHVQLLLDQQRVGATGSGKSWQFIQDDEPLIRQSAWWISAGARTGVVVEMHDPFVAAFFPNQYEDFWAKRSPELHRQRCRGIAQIC